MRKILAFGLLLPVLAGCGYGRPVGNDEYADDSRRSRVTGRLGGNNDGILILGTDRSSPQGGGSQEGAGLGVNAYLWRATLDTLSFLPLTSADPFGGVIITDWYSPPSAPDERFRATAYILGRQLRSDGVRITLFRQVRQGGAWVDAPAAAGTAAELENQVLARARELRTQSAGL